MDMSMRTARLSGAGHQLNLRTRPGCDHPPVLRILAARLACAKQAWNMQVAHPPI